jgi:predicted O-methyltransferase YrrM
MMRQEFTSPVSIWFSLNPSGRLDPADNTLWYGRVVLPDAGGDRETAAICGFNDYIQSHPGVENLLLPLRDGIMIMQKR